MMTERPRLTPAMADVRRAIRENLSDLTPDAVVLVALSVLSCMAAHQPR